MARGPLGVVVRWSWLRQDVVVGPWQPWQPETREGKTKADTRPDAAPLNSEPEPRSRVGNLNSRCPTDLDSAVLPRNQ